MTNPPSTTGQGQAPVNEQIMAALRRGLGQIRIHYARHDQWGWGGAMGYREAALQLWQQRLISFDQFKEIDHAAHQPDEVLEAIREEQAR